MAHQALMHLEGAQLLPGIDDGVLIRADAQRHAAPTQVGGRPDAVGEVALGRRADAGPGIGARQQQEVTLGEMGGVDCREGFVEEAG